MPRRGRQLILIGAWGAALSGMACDDGPSGRGEAGVPRDGGAEMAGTALLDVRAAEVGVTDMSMDAPAACELLKPCCKRHTNPEYIPSCEATATTGPAALCEQAAQVSQRVVRCVAGAERDVCGRLSRECCPRLPAADRQECARIALVVNDPAECAETIASNASCADLLYPPDAGP